jgi:arylsulfatase A
MKKWVAVVYAISAIMGSACAGADTGKPNIIFIYADDMGYGDCGVYNPGITIPTPNIDQLARDGLRFTDAHSPYATCTGSRYGLLTGTNPARTGVSNPITSAGPAIGMNEVTIAQFLKDQGYTTKMLGKWHLGFDIPKEGSKKKLIGTLTGGPLDRGFDYFYGNESSGPSSNPIKGRQKVSESIDANMENRYLCEDAVRIIKEQAASDQSKPLFLYYALLEPHNPQIPEKEFQGGSGAGAYGDYIVQLDHWVGKVIDALRETGLEQNTLVIFSSDNGASKANMSTCPGHAANGVLAGHKASSYEGGHRVPLIMKWPGGIPVSTVSTALVNHTDFFATFAELFNVDLAATHPGSAPDSYSFLPVLKDPSAQHNRPPMVAVKSYRKGAWKLIADDRKGKAEDVDMELYNLEKDLSEQTNLVTTYPEIAQELFAEYKEFLAARKLKPQVAKSGGKKQDNQ